MEDSVMDLRDAEFIALEPRIDIAYLDAAIAQASKEANDYLMSHHRAVGAVVALSKARQSILDAKKGKDS